ncbi:DNA-directed RNA polymerase subunit RPC12/RpoP [Haloferula luteola]|uniref:DNA-directed RNA polymerase subunit RPC12/RpoP n=1 Tax=Haloferula luteola TaxID=595692 RepID=A0A840V3M5_9BACT|nr:hypothetical protein [Haloferula luteola]MBB5351646.1 DNA-directed RNA polymerase subunit RPC12/RpoP [Haloferula luteola]
MSQLLELKCTNCGSTLDPTDISPQIAAARCPHCHSLFALPNAVTQPIPRGQVELPARMSLSEENGQLVIRRSWFHPTVWILVAFATFWNGFLIVWHSIALSHGMWFMSAFGLIHTAAGLAMIYAILATFLNTTTLRAGRGVLEVTQGPIPWRGNQRLDTGSLTQIFCRQKIHHGKNGSSTSYEVEAIFHGNQRRTLLKGIKQADQALFIEQQIEKFLRIVDQRVEGDFIG